MVLVRLFGHNFGHYSDLPFGHNILPSLTLCNTEIEGQIHRQVSLEKSNGRGKGWRLVPPVSTFIEKGKTLNNMIRNYFVSIDIFSARIWTDSTSEN